MIYLDNAATTALHPDVLAAMLPYMNETYGNASSIHTFGRLARAAVDNARRRLAAFVGCQPDELVFTSSATEAIHTALIGAFLANPQRRHVITSAVEHHAVLHTCQFIERLGGAVTVLPTASDGRVRQGDLLAALRPDTLLVSVMQVNNEIGTVSPVEQLAAAVKQQDGDVLFHSDMVQALGTVRHSLSDTNIDFASFSAHKVHGPKGVGAMYITRKTKWQPVLHGGAQERERRAGTENVAGIVGFAAAIERLETGWDEHIRHLRRVRDAFLDELDGLRGMAVNSPQDAVPTILNLAFEGVQNDTLLMRLDLEGVAASAGSACTAGSLEPSHVLAACGIPEDRVTQSIRFSFSDLTTEADVRRGAEVVRRVVGSLRATL